MRNKLKQRDAPPNYLEMFSRNCCEIKALYHIIIGRLLQALKHRNLYGYLFSGVGYTYSYFLTFLFIELKLRVQKCVNYRAIIDDSN